MRFSKMGMVFIMITLIFAGLFKHATVQDADAQERGAKLLIYYGTPKGINGSWDNELAARQFAMYDYVVWGAGLEEASHEHHLSSKEILKNVRDISPQTQLFGYVDIGVSTHDFSLREMKQKIRKWRQLGVSGIFLDDAGYDFEVPRERLNRVVKYVHHLGLPVCVNAWHPSDVFSSDRHDRYNPRGLPSELGSADYYLLENFIQPSGMKGNAAHPLIAEGWLNKLQQVTHYRQATGTKLLSVSMMDYQVYEESDLDAFFQIHEVAAAIFSLDGYGVSPMHYSSSAPYYDVVRHASYLSDYFNYYTVNPEVKTWAPEVPNVQGGHYLEREGFVLRTRLGHYEVAYPPTVKRE
ncbi:hypothetical protein [Marinicrinis sediminis]|uniref:Glycoside-hydrolase family GH114 TIM-barrel domain-containing protein n=1 Tax=Marinicrinis sediminis TaxID=1652465 RepID=A0ABW5R6R9_9BACL